MTPLGKRIAAMIRESGPMSVAEYMHICLNDPRHGYYTQQKAIGREGDFITAPEISQMFGELVGIWCIAIWQAMGRPNEFVLAEVGPGKGTLMADLLRVTSNYPDFSKGVKIRLIETSPAMIDFQKTKLNAYSGNLEWRNRLEDVDGLPMILVANEFLDVLPFRQFIKTSSGWLEHCVGLAGEDGLGWVTGTALPDLQKLPDAAKSVPDGSVHEISPAREAWIQILSERLAEHGGAALLIDYGYDKPGFGGTFQAVKDHKSVNPLAEPGLADLTGHVDFAALRDMAESSGIHTSLIMAQGEFLQLMGLAERAGALGADKSPEQQNDIRSQAERLVQPEQMGDLFKILALISPESAPGISNIPPFGARV
ncbi:MAG: class I SAM-dependent methyltransferase [Rhizobiaceae bacterium]